MQQLLSKVRSRGFTIIELLIVIVVIGILAAITIVAYNGIQNSARDNAVVSDLEGVASEVTRYQVHNNGAFSTDGSGSSVTWYSGGSANSNISFTPSSGDIIDVVANNTDYCIRAYNPSSKTYSTLATAATKESNTGVCNSLPASAAAVAATNTFSSITWTAQTGSGSHQWVAVAMGAGGTKLIAADYSTDTGYLYTSTDSGVTWTQRTGAGSRNWYVVVSSADGTKLAASDPTGINVYTSSDSGATWTPHSAGYFDSLAISSDGTNLVGARDSMYIWTSSDSGATWTQRTSAGSKRWNAVASSSDGTKLVATAGYPDYIYTSSDSGATWTQRTSAGSRSWGSVASSSDGTKLIAGVAYGGNIYTSTDSGVTWTAQTGSGSHQWDSVASSTDGTKLAAAVYGGYIYTSTDSGVTWTQQTSAGSRNWNSIAVSPDGAKLVAVDQGGYIYTGLYH